jgi:hypothetical protein
MTAMGDHMTLAWPVSASHSDYLRNGFVAQDIQYKLVLRFFTGSIKNCWDHLFVNGKFGILEASTWKESARE